MYDTETIYMKTQAGTLSYAAEDGSARPSTGEAPVSGIGARLRATRLQWQLTLREVEERSVALAERSGNPACRISASWLDRVERENRELSATKLIVLAVIYSLSTEQMLALCP